MNNKLDNADVGMICFTVIISLLIILIGIFSIITYSQKVYVSGQIECTSGEINGKLVANKFNLTTSFLLQELKLNQINGLGCKGQYTIDIPASMVSNYFGGQKNE